MDRKNAAIKAVNNLSHIRRFYKRLYRFPKMKPFQNEEQYKAACDEVDEITDLITDILVYKG